MVIYLLGVNWPSSSARTLATLLSIPGFGYGGIVKHWQNRARMERGELYAGFGAWAAAIAINGFGLVANLYVGHLYLTSQEGS